MIDTFAALHPSARGRFTCWNQYQNGRGENLGGRLDYIYVDEQLFHQLCTPTAGCLDCGYGNHKNLAWVAQNQYHSRSSKDAGIGGWNDAPTGGGGLPDGKPKDYSWHTTVPPHTGMVYTPPQWSDHIGVSFLMKDVVLPTKEMQVLIKQKITKEQKKATRKCQPHASVRSITSFFGKPSSSKGSSSTSSSSSKTSSKPAPKKKKKDLRNFFGSGTSTGTSTGN